MTNLVQLTGSEKQIAWAESIRAKAMNKLNFWAEKAEEQMTIAPEPAKIIMDIIESAKNQSSAKFWIDNRFESFGADWLVKERVRIGK